MMHPVRKDDLSVLNPVGMCAGQDRVPPAENLIAHLLVAFDLIVRHDAVGEFSPAGYGLGTKCFR